MLRGITENKILIYVLIILLNKMDSLVIANIFPLHRSNESSVTFLQETVREYEVCQIALDCLRSGEIPETNGKLICFVS